MYQHERRQWFLGALTYINEFGFFFFLRIAVAVSSIWNRQYPGLTSTSSYGGGGVLQLWPPRRKHRCEAVSILVVIKPISPMNSLQVDLLLSLDMIWFGRHLDDESSDLKTDNRYERRIK